MSTESALNRKPPLIFWATCLLLLILYLPVIVDLVGEWYNDSNYSHGFLIPLISIYLLWKRRLQVSQTIDVTGDRIGISLLVSSMILFVLANAAAEYFTLRLSLVLALYGTVWYLLGRKTARATWFEIMFLIFMIPLPYVLYNSLAFPMQLLASQVTVKLLNGIGLSAIRQGNIIHLPGYSLEVAEACSGLRSLISLLALGALYAHLTQKGTIRPLILFFSTIPIAIAANIFRIFFTAVGAYIVSKELAEDFLHELSGMMVFVVAFIMLFLWGAILKIGSEKKSAKTS